MKLDIGGIQFLIDADRLLHSSPLEAIGHPMWFKPKGKDYHNFDIQIRLLWEKFPPLLPNMKLTNYSKLYKIFQNESEYYIAFLSPSYIEPLLVLRTCRNFTQATVYADEKLRKEHTSDGTLEAFYLYQKLPRLLLTLFLAQRKGGLFHAATINVDGKGYVFPGISGTGKSTLVRQFIQKGTGQILNDDRIVVRKIDTHYRVFGTPWTGESGIAVNANVPLKGLFFIVHGVKNQINKISYQEALKKILSTVSLPWYDSNIVEQMLAFLDDLMISIPMYELVCTPTPDVVDVIMDHIAKQET